MNRPKQIKKISGDCGTQGVEFTWADGEKYFFDAKFLRENCPCATCLTQRGDTSHENPLKPTPSSRLKVISATLDEETRIEKLFPIGNYAIGIQWGDKHDSGIYSWNYINTLVNEKTSSESENQNRA